MTQCCDYLVIGSGLAGMLFALKVADTGRVLLVTKDVLRESNSRYAQGGVAAVWDDKDRFEDHIQDTLVAGAGLCRRETVEHVVRTGPERIRELIELGVSFDKREGRPDEHELHREGGHSTRRILHARDQTGAEIVRALSEAVRVHPNIEIREHQTVVDLITEAWLCRRGGPLPSYPDRVVGAYVLDEPSGTVSAVSARVVALCAGGAGQIYRFTSNPRVATGDGMAMAWRAGARIANMEFVQFHPTTLYNPGKDSFLVSEALRGEGGRLLNSGGERFMVNYDERLELAPRDIVARAIDAELKRRGDDCVYLDMTHHSREFLMDHFPAIYKHCKEAGHDMAEAPIPVVPACHYVCGGVRTDLNGESSIRNLFVIGEASCTGLHGANRLASNSLLEAAVFAHAAANEARGRTGEIPSTLPAWDVGHAVPADELVVIKHTWAEIQKFMWDYVGIVRTTNRLKRARRRVQMVKDELRHYYWETVLTPELVELRNLADVAGLVVESALRRRESRGLHYTLDFPESDDRWIRDTVLERRLID
ncbi:MAG: L-aspartate oxidase [Myxococcota bacterium]|nr:L-aspartate oxidase [Myxococcota bacterium]